MSTATLTSSELWRRHGDHVLMAMPYADEVLVEGRGCKVIDASGKELLDLAAGMFCCVLGHNHPEFIRRITHQMQSLLHTGTQFLSPAVLQASADLAEIAPGELNKAIFFSTGTEANEFAFRLAKAYTGRTGIAGFSRGYYGTSLATRSISSLSSHTLKDCLPMVPDSFRLPITGRCSDCFTTATECGFPCLETIDEWIGDWSQIAAVIVEPILSAGGMLIPPPGYLAALRRITQQHSVLLIVDEAQTGFGRTGKWFAIEHHNVVPDILTISKSAGNGFPVAGVITTAEIADRVVRDGLWNLSSHQSDPVAAAAVSAVIDIVRRENLAARAVESGEYCMGRLRELAREHPIVGRVRGQGLMIGFDILEDGGNRAEETSNQFMYLCRRRGLHLTFGYGNRSFRVIPPLTISSDEIDFAVEVMDGALREVEKHPGFGEDLWPANRHTRALLDRQGWRHLFQHWWQSSPQDWVRKSKSLMRERLGEGSR